MPKASSGPLAIIDIGSNSARLVIYEDEANGHFRILWSARSSLQLVRDVDKSNRLSESAVDSTVAALADFRAMIVASRSRRIVAVATAAMRDARNSEQVLTRIRKELGLRVELISSREEAYLGALGGIRALPVAHGALFDLGGGSVQIIHFKGRRPGIARSLPLGSLRLSQAYLKHDPPSKREIRALRKHVEKALGEEAFPELKDNGALVGVGGTIRNLAKIDARSRDYPIARIHGYVLTRSRLADIVKLLCSRPLSSARSIAGLSRERGDSIIGGALAIEILADMLGAAEIIVSGEGVREGLVYSLVSKKLPSIDEVRRAAVLSMAMRFRTWNREWAERRTTMASKILDALEGNAADTGIRLSLEHAAVLLDIGRSVDFFDRYEHAAAMVMNTELAGFRHHEIAMISAIIANADDEDAKPSQYQPILSPHDNLNVRRAAIVLRLADEILQRWPRNADLRLEVHVGKTEVFIIGYGLANMALRGIASRFQRLFDKSLTVRSFDSDRSADSKRAK